jgi:hypothetical protein
MTEILLGRDFNELLMHTEMNAFYDNEQRITDALSTIEYNKGVDDPLRLQYDSFQLNGKLYDFNYAPEIFAKSRPYFGYDAISDTTLHYATENKFNDVAGLLIRSKDLQHNPNIQVSKISQVIGINL